MDDIDEIATKIYALSRDERRQLESRLAEKYGMAATFSMGEAVKAPVVDFSGSLSRDLVQKVVEQVPAISLKFNTYQFGAGHEIILLRNGERRIQIIKLIREHTGLGLKDAKNMSDRVIEGHRVKICDCNLTNGEIIRRKFQDQGATVELRTTPITV